MAHQKMQTKQQVPKSKPNVQKESLLPSQERSRSNASRVWPWLKSPVIAALAGGIMAVLAAGITNIDRIAKWLNLPAETELDRPHAKTTPRTQICFYHGNNPAGWRRMTQQAGGIWVEVQPDGKSYQHKIVGRINSGPWTGVILHRLEDPEPYPVELFIPDIGTDLNSLFYRPPGGAWFPIASIEDDVSNCPRK